MFPKPIALVTGATRGIGKAVALKLAEKGFSLAICARGKQQLEETALEIKKRGEEVLALKLDANVNCQVLSAVEKAFERFKRIDVLINNAGGEGIIKEILDISDEDWLQDLNQNFLGVTRFCKATIPYMLKNKFGRIVNVSSIAAVQPDPLYIPYCTAKACIIAYSKALSKKFASDNILVNTVLPGLVDTRQMAYVEKTLSNMLNHTPGEIRKSFEESTGIGRYASPEEIAHLIVFLTSRESNYITGGTYVIDGGALKNIP
jgi:NAD(P)-dependent dehydrogenase (short-subunit alcohol dehydrogenase family)